MVKYKLYLNNAHIYKYIQKTSLTPNLCTLMCTSNNNNGIIFIYNSVKKGNGLLVLESSMQDNKREVKELMYSGNHE